MATPPAAPAPTSDAHPHPRRGRPRDAWSAPFSFHRPVQGVPVWEIRSIRRCAHNGGGGTRMDEPTEPQPVVPGDPSGDRPLPLPIGARSTVHPWEEPPILPAPSMFHVAPPTPARGRHARRSRPAGLLSAAAAASVLLVGGSAVAMLSLAASTPGQPPAGAVSGGP